MIRGRGYIREITRDFREDRATFTVVMYDWYIDGRDTLAQLARSGEAVSITVTDNGEIRIVRMMGETDEQLRARLVPSLAQVPAVEIVPTAPTPPPASKPQKEVTRFSLLELD